MARPWFANCPTSTSLPPAAIRLCATVTDAVTSAAPADFDGLGLGGAVETGEAVEAGEEDLTGLLGTGDKRLAGAGRP
jgi:hypothetical protein